MMSTEKKTLRIGHYGKKNPSGNHIGSLHQMTAKVHKNIFQYRMNAVSSNINFLSVYTASTTIDVLQLQIWLFFRQFLEKTLFWL